MGKTLIRFPLRRYILETVCGVFAKHRPSLQCVKKVHQKKSAYIAPQSQINASSNAASYYQCITLDDTVNKRSLKRIGFS